MNEDILNVSGLKVKIGKKTILDGIEVRFSRGECVLIAGANGAGKSTFLKCLAGVILPDKGDVSYTDGIGPEKIGFISDRLSLFENFTVMQGIDFHTRVFGIENFDTTLIDELRFDPAQKIKHLSAGERTLFNLSLVWSQQPQVLLIDEIIHVIDPFLRDKFIEAVIDLMDRCNTTVFMVNHTFSEIEKIPERVLVMADGRFIVDEKSEVLARSLKKVISTAELPSDCPVIFCRQAAAEREYFIYPYTAELVEQHPYEYLPVDLTEIVKTFIGGQYAEKRME
jgi:ABC-type multidrug transport system ATPase subunit